MKSFRERSWKSRPVPEGCTRYLLYLKVPTEYKIFYVLIYQSTPSELTRVGNKADSQELVRKCESETFASRGPHLRFGCCMSAVQVGKVLTGKSLSVMYGKERSCIIYYLPTLTYDTQSCPTATTS